MPNQTEKPKNENVTINDIARAASVSKKSVSRVINNESGVSEKTRETIQSIIKELGFVPDRRARALASSKSFLLGLAYNNRNPSYVLNLLRGVQSVATKSGYEVVMHAVENEVENPEENLIWFMQRSACDALILTPPLSENAALVASMAKTKWPVVRIAGDDIDAAMMQVKYDDRGAAQAITRHIIDQGHRKFGFLGGPSTAGPTRRRLAGFMDALKLNGMETEKHLIAYGNFTFDSGLEEGEYILSGESRPTAILCANDEMAAGVIHCARNMGLSIPNDVAVVGFDDSPLAGQVWPPLTSVRQPVHEMAARATELVLGLSVPEHSGLPEEFDYEIINRKSI